MLGISFVRSVGIRSIRVRRLWRKMGMLGVLDVIRGGLMGSVRVVGRRLRKWW